MVATVSWSLFNIIPPVIAIAKPKCRVIVFGFFTVTNPTKDGIPRYPGDWASRSE